MKSPRCVGMGFRVSQGHDIPLNPRALKFHGPKTNDTKKGPDIKFQFHNLIVDATIFPSPTCDQQIAEEHLPHLLAR